jgi:hypothetical protein
MIFFVLVYFQLCSDLLGEKITNAIAVYVKSDHL